MKQNKFIINTFKTKVLKPVILDTFNNISDIIVLREPGKRDMVYIKFKYKQFELFATSTLNNNELLNKNISKSIENTSIAFEDCLFNDSSDVSFISNYIFNRLLFEISSYDQLNRKTIWTYVSGLHYRKYEAFDIFKSFHNKPIVDIYKEINTGLSSL